ncbi:MAG TPA: LacI family DNA-binding transcriptional regulator [Solirubrobacterales bacterium]|nr:LacI family DNA-binding transcriptional regulator [Solirubrobacterales bacterium]
MEAKGKARVGIRDVARAAGVSPTTVSHSLSGKGRLPESTRERIARVAEELGYRPNASARNLVAGKTGLLGIAISESPESPFGLSDFDYFMQLLTAATTTAVEKGMALVVAGMGQGEEFFGGVDVDGLIVVDPVVGDQLVAANLRRGVPVVTTGRVPGETRPDDETYWVDNDHRRGTMSILDHLHERGGRKVALITTLPITSYTADDIEGYETWCEAHSQEPMLTVVEGPIDEGAGFAAAAELLDGPDPPDAIYATLDRLALGTLAAARSRGIGVPTDLIVAGCTDSKAGEWADPPLTALALNPEEIGRQVVEMLIALVQGDDPVERHQLVPTAILPRESTARVVSGQTPRMEDPHDEDS